MSCRVLTFSAALLVFATIAQAQPTTRRASRGQPSASQRSFSERYDVLEQRNIFLRDRSRPTTQRATVSTAATQPARRPEQMLLLTGVVLEDEGFRAYVEDTSTSPSRILRVSPGDKLGPGRVLEIQIDAIAYEQAGQLKWIVVGSDLAGEAISSTALAGTVATTGPADGAAASNLDPHDPNLTVEQRMRLRSMQQRQGR